MSKSKKRNKKYKNKKNKSRKQGAFADGIANKEGQPKNQFGEPAIFNNPMCPMDELITPGETYLESMRWDKWPEEYGSVMFAKRVLDYGSRSVTTHHNKHKGKAGLVIGNAPNRAGLGLSQFGDEWVKFGCNGTYAMEGCDYFCFMDWQFQEFLLSNQIPEGTMGITCPNDDCGNLLDHLGVTPENYEEKLDWLLIDNTPRSPLFSSGHIALRAACIMGCDPVVAIGFGFGDGCLYRGDVKRKEGIPKIWEQQFYADVDWCKRTFGTNIILDKGLFTSINPNNDNK